MPNHHKTQKKVIPVNDTQILRAQSKLIATRRIMGHTLKDIGQEFHMSPDTVNSRLEWARRHGLIETALDKVINELVPEALKTYLLAIQGGDVDASRDVLFGAGVLQKAPKLGQAPNTSVEMTIETYRNNRTEKTSLSTHDAQGGLQLTHGDAEESGFIDAAATLEASLGASDSQAGGEAERPAFPFRREADEKL